jgi:hypothetical protein
MDHPTFVCIEYWNAMTGQWEVGHAGLNLMNPAAYVQKLAKRGVLARAVDKETGETVEYHGAGAELL